MLKLHPVKAIQGKVELPISPDLLFLAALGACATKRTIRVAGIKESAVLQEMRRSLQSHAQLDSLDSTLTISPVATDDPPILQILPASLWVYRSMYLFIALGMGKTVIATSSSQRQTNAWIEQAKRLGITLEIVEMDHLQGLRVTNYNSQFVTTDSFINEEDCSVLLSFLLGRGEQSSFSIDFFLSTPLRHLTPELVLELNIKSASAEKSTDPVMQRLRFLQLKKKNAPVQGQTFFVHANFSPQNSQETLDLTVPGDEILAAALISAKCLVPKGSFVIANVPLESWASQNLAFIRKMGCKLSIQENNRTSFGSAGMLTMQKIELNGKKVKCFPLFQYAGQLPCMAVTAAYAVGQSVFRDLQDLRLCDPDGIDQLEGCLRTLGVRHGEMPDGIVMEGAKDFDGFDIKESLPAHIAVAFCMAGLRCLGETTIGDESITARWPEFEKMLSGICELRSQ